MTDNTCTIRAAIEQTTSELSPSSSARLDAEVLLAHCLGVDRAAIYREPERRINASERRSYDALIGRRKRGCPVAQLTGMTEFWSLPLRLNADVLVPRAETEHLVELALGLAAEQPSPRIVDLGTGSGAVALALASELRDVRVTATDISFAALSVAHDNAERLGIDNVDFVRADWLESFAPMRFDIAVSNPPYVMSDDLRLTRTGLKFEPRLALDGGIDGLDVYRRLIPQAWMMLRPNGHLCCEHGDRQGSAVRGLLRRAGYQNVETIADLAGHERVSTGTRPGP